MWRMSNAEAIVFFVIVVFMVALAVAAG